MFRVCAIALVFAAALPSWAQFRGGGRAGGGVGMPSRSGMRMSANFGPGRGVPIPGSRSVILTSPFFNPFFRPFFNPFFNRPLNPLFFRGHNPFFPGLGRFGGFGRFGASCALNPFRCNFAGGFFPGSFWGGGFPFWGGSWGGWYGGDPYSDSGYMTDTAQVQAMLAQQQQTNAQLEDQLRAERLRRFESQHDAESAAPPPPRAAPAKSVEERPQPTTVLVFGDGSRAEVQNYAIVGNTLYEFAPNRTKKFLLSDLNVPATVKLNSDRGVEFHVPSQAGTRK